jgi:hypothetical protein
MTRDAWRSSPHAAMPCAMHGADKRSIDTTGDITIMFTNQPEAVLAKAREKLYARLRQVSPSSLESSDREPTSTDLETAAAQYNALRAKLPGAATCAATAPPSSMRTALEAAAFIRGLDTGSNESDHNLACRITGRLSGEVTEDGATAIAAAFTFVLDGAAS